MSILQQTTKNTIEWAREVLRARERGEHLVSILTTTGEAAGSRVIVHSGEMPAVGKNEFAELHIPRAPLTIVGAGHIAVPLAEIGVMLGFDVTVVDDREEFADAARFPAGAKVDTLDFNDPLRTLALDSNSFIVLVTRAHKYDFDCLREILRRDVAPRYIGMIGSKRRVKAAFTALLEDGIPQEKIDAVHAPVGLDIGAQTPAEIAVSIMAEIISVRRGDADDQKVLESLTEGTILATVIATKGSVPRRAGSKMLIDPATGSIVGTIGGGCGEADVLTSAKEVAASGVPRVVHVELLDRIDSFSPAVCGGVMDIFVERVR